MAEGDGQSTPAAGRVRVLTPAGDLRGAGIMVAPCYVLTCAHVVAGALRRTSPDAPADPVRVDVGGHPGVAPGEATVVPGGWFPGPEEGVGDLAVLTTTWRPPPDVGFARLGPCGEPDRREVSVYGHPARAPDGLWSRASLAGRGGPHMDWVQLDGLDAASAWIEPGFSGAGVWDPATRRVVGMLTAALGDRRTRAAWMLPMEAAARLCPALADAVDGGANGSAGPAEPPGRGTAAGPRAERPPPQLPTDREQFALADALLGVPLVEEDRAATLRRLLPAHIRHGVRDHPRPRLQVFHVVQACVDHRDGREALVTALRMLDESSEPARAALALFDEVWPQAPGGDAP
ncbi:effector-associated domain 2-containing protein [Streptomyces sp. AN091965]|uniref:effector-associated domain 2-containing protein n=1 Tax=Streptomyces sp. AN091965 TaxID=2927803 RepID=UPI001F60D927|nr:trypsin-like peptidase domain-containing protein [Streptomyces sp. AN091965]MCI3932288.1 serine protease [Streptomyces sp. AN091965]